MNTHTHTHEKRRKRIEKTINVNEVNARWIENNPIIDDHERFERTTANKNKRVFFFKITTFFCFLILILVIQSLNGMNGVFFLLRNVCVRAVVFLFCLFSNLLIHRAVIFFLLMCAASLIRPISILCNGFTVYTHRLFVIDFVVFIMFFLFSFFVFFFASFYVFCFIVVFYPDNFVEKFICI